MKKLGTLILGLAAVACTAPAVVPPDAANATYRIERSEVTLHDGLHSEPAAPGSAVQATTRLSDKRAVGDLTGKGARDAAVVLTVQGGGSGTFSYLAVLVGDGKGAGAAVPAVSLGDRIVVQSVGIAGGIVIVNYLDRRPGEPLAATPTVAVVRSFAVRDGVLSEVK